MEAKTWGDKVVELAFDSNPKTGDVKLKPYPQIVKDSFKAGQESRCNWHKPLPQIMAEAFAEGKQAMLKEVMEWLRTMPIFIIRVDRNLNDVSRSLEGSNEWQDKLKEWGIK